MGKVEEMTVYSVREVSELLALDSPQVRKRIGSGRLGSVLVNRERQVPRDALLVYLMDEMRSSKAWEQAQAVLGRDSTPDEVFDATLSDAHQMVDLYTRLAIELAELSGDDETAARLAATLAHTARGTAR